MRFYEVTFIVDDQIGEESIKAEVKKIEDFIGNNGGKVEKTGSLGTRRFAYPIKKREHGYYSFIQFWADPPLLPSLESSLRLDEAILRYLIVAAPKKHSEEQNREESPETSEER
ncbi:MAG TPA: 30S ribosomal protein S6 [Firmicutes bacterium]|nr:30S ribosomal protein S6 [Bacillota bacterium]